MTYKQVIENLDKTMEHKYGKICGCRIIEEEHNVDRFTDFKLKTEYLICGELYTVKAHGLLDSYVYSISKLLECESVDNRP
jgi:hypothetical protein